MGTLEAADHGEHRERSLPAWWQAALRSLTEWGPSLVGATLVFGALPAEDELSLLHWAVLGVVVGGGARLGSHLSRFLAVKLGVVRPDLPGSAWAGMIVALAAVAAVVLIPLGSLPPAAKIALLLAGWVTIETVAVVTTAREPDRPDHLETKAPSY